MTLSPVEIAQLTGGAYVLSAKPLSDRLRKDLAVTWWPVPLIVIEYCICVCFCVSVVNSLVLI